jgi:malonate-semialdehyde dehydrogenase (acetylating)/methylmalonate-semialdehyde dehydrogenase
MAISTAVTVGRAGDELIAAVNEKARAVKVGPGREADSEMGPVVTSAARDRIVGLIGTGEEQGATLAVDGRRLRVPRSRERLLGRPDGHRQADPEMDAYKEEIFGRSSAWSAPTPWTTPSG